MKKLNYHELYYTPYEDGKGEKYEDLNSGKLYSIYSTDPDNSKNIENILFSPPGSEEYAANMKLPSTEIHFYDFSVWDTALKLDDIMKSHEINPCFGFFISPRAKKILNEYNLSAHKYYPVTIYFQNKAYQYFFLLISQEDNALNYSKSTFIERFSKTPITSITKYEDLLKKEVSELDGSEYWISNYAKATRVVFKNPQDIYSPVTSISTSLFFSERLKQRLEKEGVTGIEFYPEEELEFYLDK